MQPASPCQQSPPVEPQSPADSIVHSSARCFGQLPSLNKKRRQSFYPVSLCHSSRYAIVELQLNAVLSFDLTRSAAFTKVSGTGIVMNNELLMVIMQCVSEKKTKSVHEKNPSKVKPDQK